MAYSYSYNTNYNPAMPAMEIALGRARSNPSLALVAVVDSGADMTIVPIRYLKQIRARKGRRTQMRGVAGVAITVDLYAVALRLAVYERAEMEVVADAQNHEVILGRDILNQFVVTLNGLASVVELSQ